MGDQLRESESQPVPLEYASGDAARSRWPWAVWSFNAIVLVVVVVAIIVPFLGRGRAGHRVQCGTNLKQILTVLATNALQNQGSLPPTLRAAFPQSLTAGQSKLLQCPVGPGAYVYLGAGLNLNAIPRDTILIYEPPSNHKSSQLGKAAINIARADGSVHFIESPQVEKIIAELKAGHNPPRAEMVK